MLINVAINNYNYARFLPACIDSVLAQSRQADRIVIVDDGSSDDSRAIIEAYARQHSKIMPVFKPNGGQLSAFNAALPHLDGDIVCFLDADDWYGSDHLQNVAAAFLENPQTQLVYSSYQIVPATGIPCIVRHAERTITIRALRTFFLKEWFGVPTSMISIRREALLSILPYDDEPAWKSRADDVLVFIAALNNFPVRYAGGG